MKATQNLIPNFTHASFLEVFAMRHPNPSIGSHVLITQDEGSMRLQHGMTAKQARDMAAALIVSADEADQMAVIECAPVFVMRETVITGAVA